MIIRHEEKQKLIEAFKTIAEFAARAAIEHVELKSKASDPTSPEAVQVQPLVYNRKQAAQALGVSVSTLRRFVDAGEITPIMLTGKSPKYDPAEIELLLRRKRGQFQRG